MAVKKSVKIEPENKEINNIVEETEKEDALMEETPIVETPITKTQKSKIIEEKEAVGVKSKPKFKKEIPLNTLVTVINGTYGELIYISKRTVGMKVTWGKFGDDYDLELGELVSIRNSDRKFFENNWFLIEDQDIIDYLGVGQYYQNKINLNDFENIFKDSPQDIIEKVSNMSEGLKRTVAARAYELIQEKQIYSSPIILALEEATGYELN